MENSDLLQKLNQKYKSLSKGQKQLANYIMSNYDKAAFVTASKMGRIVGVSESTVVRFAYALGYDGYPELQKTLQELIRNKLTSVQRIQLSSDIDQKDVLRSVLKADVDNIRATIEHIDNKAFDKVMDMLFAANKVYIVGIRSASPLAEFMAYYLGFVLENVITVNARMGDVYESMLRITENDLCIGISFPRYSTRTIEALNYAKSKNAHIVAITDSMFSPIAELAEHSLIARSDMASYADSLVAPLSLINAIIVAAGIRKKEEISERFSQLENIWGVENVYVTKDTREERGRE